jgi:hypothetical protein
LSESSEGSDADSSNEDDAAVTTNKDAPVSARAEKTPVVSPDDGHRATSSVSGLPISTDGQAGSGIGTGLRDSGQGVASFNESGEPVADAERAPFLPDHDFVKQWYADGWERQPGQMWTDRMLRELKLEACLREQGFTGDLLKEAKSTLRRSKGFRQPLEARKSLKILNLSHSAYVAALRQRRERESRALNVVNEYDEDAAYEGLQRSLRAYEIVYGPEGPEGVLEARKNETQTVTQGDDSDGEYVDDEPAPKRRQTRQQVAKTLERTFTRKAVVDPGITLPPPHEKIGTGDIAERNEEFRKYRDERVEEARKEREIAEIRSFLLSADNSTFSNGYIERWKEPRTM